MKKHEYTISLFKMEIYPNQPREKLHFHVLKSVGHIKHKVCSYTKVCVALSGFGHL